MSGEEQMNREDIEHVQTALKALIEHFDSVQIFVTRHEAGTLDGTVTVALGAGNWFARYGQVKAWSAVQDQHNRNAAIKHPE